MENRQKIQVFVVSLPRRKEKKSIKSRLWHKAINSSRLALNGRWGEDCQHTCIVKSLLNGNSHWIIHRFSFWIYGRRNEVFLRQLGLRILSFLNQNRCPLWMISWLLHLLLAKYGGSKYWVLIDMSFKRVSFSFQGINPKKKIERLSGPILKPVQTNKVDSRVQNLETDYVWVSFGFYDWTSPTLELPTLILFNPKCINNFSKNKWSRWHVQDDWFKCINQRLRSELGLLRDGLASHDAP